MVRCYTPSRRRRRKGRRRRYVTGVPGGRESGPTTFVRPGVGSSPTRGCDTRASSEIRDDTFRVISSDDRRYVSCRSYVDRDGDYGSNRPGRTASDRDDFPGLDRYRSKESRILPVRVRRGSYECEIFDGSGSAVNAILFVCLARQKESRVSENPGFRLRKTRAVFTGYTYAKI